MHRLTATRGFTLIELLFVISIIGLLASVVFTSLTSARLKARIGAGQTQNTAIVRAIGDSLVGEWRLNETGGTTATDFSGLGNDATIVGPVSFVSGIQGGAFSFPGGVMAKAEVTAYTKLIVGKPEFTLAFWFKPSGNITTTQVAMSHRNTYVVWVLNANRIQLGAVPISSGTFNYLSTANNVLRPNEWQFVAITYNGSVATIYHNGRVVVSGPLSIGGVPTNGPLATPTTPFKIGVDFNDTTPVAGDIDEVRLYSKAINNAMISQLYIQDAPKYGLAAPL